MLFFDKTLLFNKLLLKQSGLLIVNFNRTMNYFEKKPKVNKYCNKKITRKFQEKLSI